jgi:hypothetical protein
MERKTKQEEQKVRGFIPLNRFQCGGKLSVLIQNDGNGKVTYFHGCQHEKRTDTSPASFGAEIYFRKLYASASSFVSANSTFI